MRRTKQHTKKTDHEYVSQEEEKGNTYSEQNHCITLSELHGTNNYTHKSTHLKKSHFLYYDRAEYIFFWQMYRSQNVFSKIHTKKRREKENFLCANFLASLLQSFFLSRHLTIGRASFLLKNFFRLPPYLLKLN